MVKKSYCSQAFTNEVWLKAHYYLLNNSNSIYYYQMLLVKQLFYVYSFKLLHYVYKMAIIVLILC